jgi:ferritin-like metal-binding protein YciE
MAMDSLDKIYGEKLNDLYDAEKQIIAALPKVVKATSSSDLKETFEKHLEQTNGHVMRLDKIFERNGEREDGKGCIGMEGLLKDGEELLTDQERGPALDAALIAAAQSVEHYEIAGYGSAQTWARRLGDQESANLLEETLEEEKQTDAELTEIAGTLVNPEAGGTADEEEDIEDEETTEGDEEDDQDIEEDGEEETAEGFNSDGQESNIRSRNVQHHGKASEESRSPARRKPKC